jgi:hypothetical protein
VSTPLSNNFEPQKTRKRKKKDGEGERGTYETTFIEGNTANFSEEREGKCFEEM